MLCPAGYLTLLKARYWSQGLTKLWKSFMTELQAYCRIAKWRNPIILHFHELVVGWFMAFWINICNIISTLFMVASVLIAAGVCQLNHDRLRLSQTRIFNNEKWRLLPRQLNIYLLKFLPYRGDGKIDVISRAAPCVHHDIKHISYQE